MHRTFNARFVLLFALATAVDAAESLKSPKQLVPPISLTRADYYMDGGSVGGTLVDTRGRRLDFFFDRGFDSKGDIYIGFVSGHRTDAMKANYRGWERRDLYQVIEQTIVRQFVWDAAARTLRPRNPDDPHSRAFQEHPSFEQRAVVRILRHVEAGLDRKTSYAPRA